MDKVLKNILVLPLLILLSNVWGQELPVVNFTTEDYGGMAQNSAITQLSNGDLIVANNDGILIYNGLGWKSIRLQNTYSARSVKVYSDSVVYVSGQGEIGELRINSNGFYHYKSLNDLIPEEFQNFSDVWNVNINGADVYFQSKEFVFKYNTESDSIAVFDLDNSDFSGELSRFHLTFSVADRLFVRQRLLGLLELNSEGFVTPENFEFWSDITIRDIWEENDSFVIVSQNSGLFKCDQNFNSIYAVKNSFSEKLKEIGPSKILKLGNGDYSVTTYSNGLYVVTKEGAVLHHLTSNNGLVDDFIMNQFIDKNGFLWLALSNGVTMVNIYDPVTYYPNGSGVEGTILDIKLFNEKKYLSGFNGVFVENDNGGFDKIEGVGSECMSMDVVAKPNGDSTLLIASTDRIIELNFENEVKPLETSNPYCVKYFNGRLYVGQQEGLYYMYPKGNKWSSRFKVSEVEGNVFALKSDSNNLYVGTFDNGSYVIQKSDTCMHIGQSNGLSSALAYSYPSHLGCVVVSEKGLFLLEDSMLIPINDRFFLENGNGVHRFFEDLNGDVYLESYNGNGTVLSLNKKNEKGYSKTLAPFVEYNGKVTHTFYDDGDYVWMGGTYGLIKYRKDKGVRKLSDYKVQILDIGLRDSVLLAKGNQLESSRNDFKYENNSLKFHFSSEYYYRNEKNQYSLYLEGNDEGWSEYKAENSMTYTNLSEGDYTFRVKAKNIYGKESKEAKFSFTVLPPWYRTWWAYLMYIVIGVGLIRLLIKINEKRLKAENLRLEGIVALRTNEIENQKKEIEQQADSLVIANHELEEKNNDIIASITYAKRIQESILPSDTFIQETFKNAFVYYKPKDIVSGDFYWAESNDEYDYIAAADCTGHGVPGAMVSVVGRNGLDKCLKEFKKYQPGEILDGLTDIVIDSFSKNDKEEIKDGMDIAMIALSRNRDHLLFAGAYNPLYIIRSAEQGDVIEDGKAIECNLELDGWKLFEIKATPQPIGQYIDRKPFDTFKVDIKQSDAVYMFSDGYVDQFGGPRGRKFMSKRFKKLLLSIQGESVHNQLIQLQEVHNKWKGSEEQLDDICVIGLKI